jgi:hypothetical protein
MLHGFGNRKKSLLEAILTCDQIGAVFQLDELAKQYQYQRIITEVLEPVWEEIGNGWVADRISLAAGYLAGKIVEHTLKKALACEEIIPGDKSPVVIGNVEDDYHSLMITPGMHLWHVKCEPQSSAMRTGGERWTCNTQLRRTHQTSYCRTL